ncbi:MAG: Leu/Ile/Val-binding protein [candidate division NC10 bacterium RIFCSPLOWO2_12_FULL_66_18]|nr:MAG: Leu/Ile/Val-binding protein [candidate division NC10 bacterium RIFCSPLOWO2_02_FULL_66_22]OGC00810.1 MAG: Leu/Ile/Val-binding protein [candidate division NC10 bacterium RIFCSPLOWO2_12_FULL_66_18]
MTRSRYVRWLHLFLAVLIALLTLVGTPAAQTKEVVIGVLYPMTGPVAQVGIDSVNALKVALDIINNDVNINLPLGRGAGLPRLGGAKVRIVVVDHQGKPDIGLAEAERLITQEKVHALFGAYFSSVTNTASQVAERMGIPFLNAESSSPALTERGFKWFFRTSPHDGHFSLAMFDFMRDFEKKRGIKFKSVAILNEDTQFGADSAKVQDELAKKYGYEVVARLPFRTGTTSLDAEVGRLRTANADVVLPSLYTSDAILLTRTARNLDYNPKVIIAQNAGYTDPKFVAEMGKEAEGAITRAPFALDMSAKKPLIPVINDMFKKLSGGRDLSDVPARAFTGFLTLADAINRAGSTDPGAIQKALRETNIPADQLLMPWTGVRFDEKGQNAGVRAILQQLQGGTYHTIYPFELATKDAMYPIPAWSQRK